MATFWVAVVTDINNKTKPFCWAYHMKLKSENPDDVFHLADSLRSYFQERDANHAVISSSAFVLVLLEEEIEINNLLFKLTVGTEHLGHQQFDFKPWVKKHCEIVINRCGHILRGF